MLHDGAEQAQSLVVPLQKQITIGYPYYALSGSGGHVIGYQILDKLMSDEWRGYGVLHPGFIAGSEYTPTIEGYAEKMLGHILQNQKEGPFFLVGYSMGGNICLEIAQLLMEQGLKVGVVLVDVKIYSRAKLKNMLRRIPVRIYGEIGDFLRKIRGGNTELQQKKKATRIFDDKEMPDVIPDSFARVIRDSRLARQNYQLKKTSVPTVLIRCKDYIWYDRRYDWEEDYGWKYFTDLRAVLVSPGDHLNMIKPPQAKFFVKELERGFDILNKYLSS